MKKPRIWLGIMSRRGQWELGYFRRLQRAGKRFGVIVYVFSPEGLRLSQGWTWGHRYKNGRWYKRRFPLPDLVYNRIYYGRSERGQMLKKRVQRWRRIGRPIFLNEAVPGKWKSYVALRKNEALLPYLPETHILRSRAVFRDMISRHRSVFIKPIYGMQGRGILRVTRRGGCYHVKGRDWRNHTRYWQFYQGSTVYRFIRTWLNGRRAVCQQALRLDWWNNRPLDLRILLQKDGEGIWQITGKAARVGKKNTITSNLHGGGSVLPVSKILADCCQGAGCNTEQKMKELDQLSLSVARSLEAAFGRMGELGLDIGLDHRGRFFVLECNTQPGRRVLVGLSRFDLYRLAVERPIQYARYLATRKQAGESV